MKHFVRILIAVLIVGLIGFGVWFFAFRDKNHEAVFKEMTAAIDHLGEVSIRYEYKSGNETKSSEVVGYNNIINKYLSVNTEMNQSIDDKDNDDPSDDEVKYVSANLNNVRSNIEKLKDYDMYSMDAINYYYTLTVTAEDVKNKDKRDLIPFIEAYVNAVDTVVEVVDDSISFYYVKNANDETQANDILAKDVVLFKNMLAKEIAQTKLYFELRDYVEKYVFDGVVPDYKSAMYNIYANQLNIVCNELWDDPNDETDNLTADDEKKYYTNATLLSRDGTNPTLIESLYVRCISLASENGYIDLTRNADGFINSYNKLYGKNPSYIANILAIKGNKDYQFKAEDTYKNEIKSANRNGFVKYYNKIISGTATVDVEAPQVCSKFLINNEAIKAEDLQDIYTVLSYIRVASPAQDETVELLNSVMGK